MRSKPSRAAMRSSWVRLATRTLLREFWERGILLKLRFELDQYINLRPVRLYPGVETPLAGKKPEDIDFIVVRENTEDLYTGIGGVFKKGHQTKSRPKRASIPARVSSDVCGMPSISAGTATGENRLTLVAKTNVLTFAHDLWWRAFQEISKEYPDIETDYNHVDACCMWMIKNPEHYDVIVTTNMFGDIITDLAAMIQGGMGVAAGGNIRPGGVSMFEPMGGCAEVHRDGQDQSDRRHRRRRHDGRIPWPNKRRKAHRESHHCCDRHEMKSMSAGKMGFTTSEVGDLVCENL